MRKRNIVFVLLIAAAGLSQARAGGLWITEYGQPSQGRAGAGEEAGSGTAADAFLNPAAMTRLKGPLLMFSVGAIASSVEFDVENNGIVNGDGDGGDAGSLAPGGSIFYAHPLNDRWVVGISGLALTGAALDYDNQWAGRFQTTEVSLIVAGVVPTVGYRVTDRFSVGLGLPVMYSNLDMDVRVPNPQTPVEGPEGKVNLDGNDVQVAGSASFLYEFSDATRLGGRVTSKFDFDYDGDISADLIGQVGVETNLTMAAMARVGLSHDFNEKWSGYLTWGWDNWSELKDVFISTNTGGASLARNWRDTYHYAAGADYRLNSQWTLRSGVAYDTNPVDKEDRTADLPIDRQMRYAFGADYVRQSGLKISGSLVYADYGDAAIVSEGIPPAFGFEGDYKTNDFWFASVTFDWPLAGQGRP